MRSIRANGAHLSYIAVEVVWLFLTLYPKNEGGLIRYQLCTATKHCFIRSHWFIRSECVLNL